MKIVWAATLALLSAPAATAKESVEGMAINSPKDALLLVSTVTAARAAWQGPRAARGLGAAIVGLSFWQLFQFVYGDLGGATSLVTSVVIGLALWFGLEQGPEEAGS